MAANRYKPQHRLSPRQLKEFRRQRDISQPQAAALADVSVQTWRCWEQDQAPCQGPAALLIKILASEKAQAPATATA